MDLENQCLTYCDDENGLLFSGIKFYFLSQFTVRGIELDVISLVSICVW
jgi:hypothetical protein